jgi:hypothetical protein
MFKKFVFFVSLILAANRAVVAIQFNPVNAVPKGFETIAEEENTIPVDIFFGGQNVGSVMATVGSGFIRFKNPLETAHRIPYLADVEIFASEIDRKLPVYKIEECENPSFHFQTVCIAYDDKTFKADIFVSPRLLLIQGNGFAHYLPTPNSGLSSFFRFNAAVSGTDKEDAQYNLITRGFLSYNENYVSARLSHNEDDTIIENIVAERRKNSLGLRAGYFPLEEFKTISQVDILGAGIFTNIKTRIDLDRAYGSQIEIYIPFRSQINIKKDGRLISTGFYEAGNQIIDTSELPHGAYYITLEIMDFRGQTTEKEYFFVKSDHMPPKDMPLLWLYGGYLQKDNEYKTFPKIKNVPLANIGAAKRLTDNFGISSNIAATEDQSLIEAGTHLEAGSFRVGNNFTAATDGDFGTSMYFLGYFGKLTANFDIRKIWLYKQADVNSDFDPLNRDGLQMRASASFNLSNWRFSLKGSYKKNKGFGEQYSYGPIIKWDIFRKGRRNLTLTASAFKTDFETVVGINLTASLFHGKWLFSASAEEEITENSTTGKKKYSERTNTTLAWQNDNFLGGEFRTYAGHRYQNVHSADAGMRYYSNIGRLNSDVTFYPDITRYSSNAQVSLLQGGSKITFGGRYNKGSAVIVRVDSDVKDARFEVLVNDTRYTAINVNSSVPVFLDPYRKYKISIKNVSEELLTFDAAAKFIVLYPGNVEVCQWQAKRTAVIFGLAYTPENEPIKDAIIRNTVSYSKTEENGFFQLSTYLGEDLILTKTNGSVCTMKFPNIAPVNDVIKAGKLICK